jgi:hypothetical protein
MQLEAIVPESRGTAVVQLAEELGLSRSQLIDEALSLFLQVVFEVRRGRRLVMVDPVTKGTVGELATPTLMALEWAANPQKLTLSPAAIAQIEELVDAPPLPSARLKEAALRSSR